MKVDTSQISSADAHSLAITFLEAVERFYADPKNEKAFQDWLKGREKTNQ